MKTKKVWIFAGLLLITLVIFTGGIFAWLTDTKATSPTNFTVGDVSYNWTAGAFKTTNVVPGENVVVTPFNLTNTSNVNSELRIKIEIKDASDVDATSLVVYTLGTGWVLDNLDGYYYYRVGTPVGTTYPIIPTTNIDVLSGLSLNGALVGNDYVGEVFTVSIVFQAKQAEYVVWADLGTINFATGL